MSYEPATAAGLPFPVGVELASLGDGLQRWIRLRLVWKQAVQSDGNENLEPLSRLLDEALTGAEADARAMAAFFEANGPAVNALIASLDPPAGAGAKFRAKLENLDADPAAQIAARAQSFLDGCPSDRDRVADTSVDPSLFELAPDPQMCNALIPLMLNCWAACGDGCEAACGSIWSEMYERWC